MLCSICVSVMLLGCVRLLLMLLGVLGVMRVSTDPF